MKENKNTSPKIEDKKLATSISELPELQPGFVRAVHFCRPFNIEHIIKSGGLNYEKYGIADSMARAWQNPKDVEFSSKDPRYSSPELVCAIFDMTCEEWNKHVRINSQNIPPGLIPVSKLVGVIPANQSNL